MRQLFIWFLLLIKRQLKNIVNVIILLCFALLMIIETRYINSQSVEKVVIGLMITDESKDGTALQSYFTESNACYQVQFYNDEQSLRDDVKKGDVYCGYIFGDNIADNIINAKTKGQIIKITKKSAYLDKTIDEYIFSNYYRLYSRNYIKGNLSILNIGDEYKETYDKLYNQISDSGNLFEVIFEDINKERIDTSKETDLANVLSVRGIYSVVAIIMAMLGIYMYNSDNSRGIFGIISSKKKNMLRVVYPLANSAIPMAVYILMAIGTKRAESVFVEIIATVTYVITLSVIIGLLSFIAKDNTFVLAAIPVAIFFTVIVCPVIIDFSPLVSIIKIIRKIHPTYYYLSL